MQADLTQRGRETLDPHALVVSLSFAELLAPLVAGLLDEAVDGYQEERAALDVENHTDVRALAQVEIAAGYRHTTDQGRPERLAQDAAAQTELLLVAAFQAVVATVDLVASEKVGAPFLAQLAEFDELANAVEGDVIVVARDELGQRFGGGLLALHHLLPRMLRDVDAPK